MAVVHEFQCEKRVTSTDPSSERPPSVLERGVHIRDFSDTQLNPHPSMIEDSDKLLAQYLSPRKLCLLAGVDKLEDVLNLEMKVDTSEMSLGNFGSYLPNLVQLKLSNSLIHSIRDLGSCLRGLQVLWMSRCGLQEVDGISSMINLKELYLSYNEISDVSPLSMLDSLEILDLEGNNIETILQVQYLSFCQKLIFLTLEGNPVCMMPSPSAEELDYDYRTAVKNAISHLEYLDDEPFTGSSTKIPNVFDEDWAYLEELQQDARLQQELASIGDDVSAQSMANVLRPASSYRPGSALRPSSGMRPISVRAKSSLSASQGTSHHPWMFLSRPNSVAAINEVCSSTVNSSDLTKGSVICGNVSKALLSRVKQQAVPPSKTEIKPFPQHCFESVPACDSPLSDGKKDFSDIIGELKAWKIEHEKRRKKILDSWAPQVLKIEHTGTTMDFSDPECDLDKLTDTSRLECETPVFDDKGEQRFVEVANFPAAASAIKDLENVSCLAGRDQESREPPNDKFFEAKDDGTSSSITDLKLPTSLLGPKPPSFPKPIPCPTGRLNVSLNLETAFHQSPSSPRSPLELSHALKDSELDQSKPFLIETVKSSEESKVLTEFASSEKKMIPEAAVRNSLRNAVSLTKKLPSWSKTATKLAMDPVVKKKSPVTEGAGLSPIKSKTMSTKMRMLINEPMVQQKCVLAQPGKEHGERHKFNLSDKTSKVLAQCKMVAVKGANNMTSDVFDEMNILKPINQHKYVKTTDLLVQKPLKSTNLSEGSTRAKFSGDSVYTHTSITAPVIRHRSPIQSVPVCAALAMSTQPRIRCQFSKVPSLPSKPSVPKPDR